MKTALTTQLRPALLLLSLVVVAGLAPRVEAVDFVVRGPRDLDTAVVGIGQSITLGVSIVNDATSVDGQIQGFQMAISYDSAAVDLGNATWEGTALQAAGLNGGSGPDFYLVNEVAGGVTLGVVFQDDAFSFALAAGTHRVTNLQLIGRAATPPATPSTVEFVASLGDPAIENKYTTRQGQTLAPASTAGIALAVSAVSYAIHFSAGSATVPPGNDLVLPIQLTNAPLPVYGFSFGVEHDASRLTFKELRTGAGLRDVIGDLNDPPFVEDSPFYALNSNPDGGDGFTVALILNSSDSTKFLDPALSPHHIFDAVYGTGAEGFANVSLTDTLGSPPVGIYLDLFGVSQPPEPAVPVSTSVSVTIGTGGGEQGVPFLRGDVDQSGNVNITDPQLILGFLFAFNSIRNPAALDTIENCMVALNADGSLNGSGVEGPGSVSITDAIFVLEFMFRSGRRPPAPFPSCGQPDADVAAEWRCTSFTCR